MNPVFIPTRPAIGEVWFYLDLSVIEPAKIPALFTMLESLGLSPKWAYRQILAGIECCVLLYHGHVSPSVEPPQELYAMEQSIIAQMLDDTSALHFVCGLQPRQPAIAA